MNRKERNNGRKTERIRKNNRKDTRETEKRVRDGIVIQVLVVRVRGESGPSGVIF